METKSQISTEEEKKRPKKFDDMQYFTIAPKGRGRKLEYVKNMLVSSGTENEEIADEIGESEPQCPFGDPPPCESGEPCCSATCDETHRIFIKVRNTVYSFDHHVSGNLHESVAVSYAIDLDHKFPRFQEVCSHKFYPDMAEIWCCQNSIGARRIVHLVSEEEATSEHAQEEMNDPTCDGSESPETMDSSYDVDYSRDQLVTFLLGELSPNGTTLHVRIRETDKRIPTWLAIQELEEIVGETVPVLERVWETAKDMFNLYSEDEDVAKHVKRDLETSLLVSAQHICATFPCQDRFVIDLTQEECSRVTFDARPFVSKKDGLNGRWAHIDYYDMSGDFQWVCSYPEREVMTHEPLKQGRHNNE